MSGQSFGTLRRRIALLCVALCLAVCAQATAAIQDRLKHSFGVAHAPSSLAGLVMADHHADTPHHHHHHGEGHHGSGHAHPHDGTAPDHRHLGDGMLSPWLVATAALVAPQIMPGPAAMRSVSVHPDATPYRRERPPKTHAHDLA